MDAATKPNLVWQRSHKTPEQQAAYFLSHSKDQAFSVYDVARVCPCTLTAAVPAIQCMINAEFAQVREGSGKMTIYERLK